MQKSSRWYAQVIWIVIVLSMPFKVQAQSSGIDSLNIMDQNDTMQLDALLKLSWHFKLVEQDKAILCATKALQLSQKLKDNWSMASAYNTLGLVYDNQNHRLDTIIQTYDLALKALEKTKVGDNQKAVFKGNILNNMALPYKRTGQFDKAFSLHQEALLIGEGLGNLPLMCRCLNNMGNILKDQGDEEKALQYYKRALKYAEDLENAQFIAYLTNNIGLVYRNVEKYDTALIYFAKALELKREMGDKYGTVTTLTNISSIYRELGYKDDAFRSIQEAYEVSTNLSYIYGQGLALSEYALNYFDQQNYKEAILYAKKGLEVLGKEGAIELKATFYDILKDSYIELHIYKEAFYAQQAYYMLQDSALNVKRQQQTQELTIRYEVARKETENQLLKIQQESAYKIIKHRNVATIGLIIVLFLIGGWGLAIFRAYHQGKKYRIELENTVKERTKDLQISNKNLEQANYELQTFNYIASHDIKEPIRNIGNFVGFIQHKLPENIKEDLNDYFEIINKSAKQLYTLIEDFAQYSNLSGDEHLRHEEVDLNALIESLRYNMYQTLKKANGKIVTQNLPKLKTSSSMLYVALKNLAENGIKFNSSQVPTIEIAYREAEAFHQIEVSDNGIGIAEEYHDQIFKIFTRLHNREKYQGTGIGLAIVKLAMNRLNGGIKVEQRECGGSSFILELPK